MIEGDAGLDWTLHVLKTRPEAGFHQRTILKASAAPPASS
jgi:hypothetical protein